MDTGSAFNIIQETIVMATKLSAPLLVLSMLVGLLISIVQAATQIHEQTLTFVPKLLLLALILLATGPWILENLMDFMNRIFELMLE